MDNIQKTAIVFAGDPVQWPGRTRSKADAVALASIVLMFGLGSWGLWHLMEIYWYGQFEAALLCIGFLILAVIVFFSNSPSLRIDETGITTAPKAPWRRRVLWKDVDRCEIVRATSLYGNSLAPWCSLKDREGNVLMKLHRLKCQSLPLPGRANERVELETEIKHRLIQD